MTVLDDPLGATTSELADELIFMIASATSDDQRKYATELFRHLARQIESEAFQRGRQSVATRELPAPRIPLALEAPAIQPEQPSDDTSPVRIPQVRWQD